MMTSDFVTLTGIYIQIEPLDETHRNVLKTISNDERISMYSPALKLKFDTWFNKALNSYPESHQKSFIVRTLSDNRIIGSTRYYKINPEHKKIAIGYTWFLPDVWGTVVNVECKLLLLRHAFETLQMNRVEFFIDSRNERSCSAVKKLGAKEEGLLRQHIILEDGFIRDTVVYSILKHEWLVVLAKLERRLSSS